MAVCSELTLGSVVDPSRRLMWLIFLAGEPAWQLVRHGASIAGRLVAFTVRHDRI